MVEREDRIVAGGPLVHEVEPRQLGQVPGHRPGPVPHRLQQPLRKLPTQDGGGLQEPLVCVDQPVDARAQHGPQAVRDGERVLVVAVLDDGARHFAQEERVALGLLEDCADERRGQARAVGHGLDQRPALDLAQRRQHDLGGAFVGGPGLLPVGPVRRHQENWRVVQAVDQRGQVTFRRRVDPVQVFQQHEQRPAAARREQHLTQRLDRPRADHLGHEILQRVAGLEPEQVEQQGRMLGRGRAPARPPWIAPWWPPCPACRRRRPRTAPARARRSARKAPPCPTSGSAPRAR